MQPGVTEPRRRGIYLLPNLFTTATLFAGFYAIVAAMQGRFIDASTAIFVAMVMDGLDGRVARLTNTQSEFGAQYDSLADMVSFGVAPALIMYEWMLHGLAKLGWAAAFIYVAAAALRLARFNTQVATADKRYFQGLPSPAAAALSMGFVWTCVSYDLNGFSLSIVAGVLTAATGALMVSNFRYHSFKGLDFKGRVPFFVMLLIVLGFVFISIDPPIILCALFFVYACSGPVLTPWQIQKARSERLRKGE